MKKCKSIGIVAFVALIVIVGIYAFHFFSSQEGHNLQNNIEKSAVHSQYAGQEERGIKALSQDDIKGLLSGAGTPFGGMAKPAELNGYPGPRHILDAFEAGELELTNEQYQQIQALYEEMRAGAIELGDKIIEIEKSLDDAFTNKSITIDSLQEKVEASAEVYAQLRVIHLKYHLQMVDILSEEQVAQYNHLRGYTKAGGPCENIPDGHDPEMWKLHNNCKE
jgi:Spy/CpxP family protein refolding chaperone